MISYPVTVHCDECGDMGCAKKFENGPLDVTYEIPRGWCSTGNVRIKFWCSEACEKVVDAKRRLTGDSRAPAFIGSPDKPLLEMSDDGHLQESNLPLVAVIEAGWSHA